MCARVLTLIRSDDGAAAARDGSLGAASGGAGPLGATGRGDDPLGARFAAAAGGEPLDDLSADQRSELVAVLERAATFEDLPGKWQAALLQAEGARTGGGCCH